MADSENIIDETETVVNQESSEALAEPINIVPSVSKDGTSPSDTEPTTAEVQPEDKNVDGRSSEKLLTESNADEKGTSHDNKDVEEQLKEEEYEEEVINEDGTTTVIKKTRQITEPSSKSLKIESDGSFTEKEEEYEEEETDESGEKRMVKKTRMVQVRREPKTDVSYTEIEEEYDEEETDETGELITVKKKRVIKVPKKEDIAAKESEHLKDDMKDKTSEKEEQEETEMHKEAEEEGDVEEVGEEEDEYEDVEEEEEEEAEVFVEGTADEQEYGEEKKKKVIRKKTLRKVVEGEEEILEEGEEIDKVKKQRRRKRKLKVKKQKSIKSEISKEDETEEEAMEAKSKIEEQDLASIASKSSEDVRREEERAAIGAQFEILTKLRSEYITLRRKLFFLNNKLLQYLKKQKMDHVFTETKDDPDAEFKYAKKLNEFFEINQHHMEERLKINTEWEAQRSLNEELAEKVKQEMEELMTHKREVASKLIDARTGRTVPHDKAIEDLLTRQEHLLKQISECRLTQIKLKRRIEERKKEREMDHMGADFNLMDYEKLSSLKEHYIDKITERDIEIGEVTQKLNNTEDKLRIVRDRLKEKQEEINSQQQRLQRISSELNKKRANLTLVTATRHKTEKNTSKMKQQSGLLSYPNLLKDYDEKNEEVIELTNQIQSYKQTFHYYKHRIEQLQLMSKKRSMAKFSMISHTGFS